VFRIRRGLERERFDLIHVHEPLTPAVGVAALAMARSPIVATFHACGELAWLKLGKHFWGFLMDRIDQRIAVSEPARDSVARYFPGHYDLIPNGVLVPERAKPGGREEQIVFVGRQEPRKGLQVLLRAWPEIRRRTNARLRVVGADPLAVRLLFARLRVSEEGVDVLGFLSQDALTAELLSAKALVAPSLGGESFGMVLTRAFACATPVVASDIPGYRGVMEPEAGRLVPPSDPKALADAVVELLADEASREDLGRAARAIAVERYSWETIAQRLAEIYEPLAASRRAVAA
jgi:phosphatidylinositol alpha-mannosyltransferase